MKVSLIEPMLIDGHAHLNEIEDVNGAIERAREKGITHIVAVGMDIESNRRTLALAAEFPDSVYPAIGYHPWSIQADAIDATLAYLDRHLERCIAVGEVGLDYKVKLKKPVQWEVFARVLDLANRYGKPVIVHARYSHQRCHRMVADAGIEKAVFHWFSGPLDVLDRIIEDGYWVSCTPALGYSPAHQAAIKKAPLNRILIETDCPVQYRGKASEPAHLVDTLAHLGRMKDLPLEKVARVTTANAREFFRL